MAKKAKKTKRQVAKKRNPQDTTLRNTRSANQRLMALAQMVRALQQSLNNQARRLTELEERF